MHVEFEHSMIDRLKEIIKNTNSRAISQVVKSKANYDLYEWVLRQH